MIRKQLWRPDTCQCQIEEQYDTEIENSSEMSQVIFKCEAHQSVSDEELYGVLYKNPDGENRVKNLMLKELLENPVLDLSQVKNGAKVLKDGLDYEWSFEGEGKQRKLKINVKGVDLPKKDKDNLKSFADTKFGNGKVEVI